MCVRVWGYLSWWWWRIRLPNQITARVDSISRLQPLVFWSRRITQTYGSGCVRRNSQTCWQWHDSPLTACIAEQRLWRHLDKLKPWRISNTACNRLLTELLCDPGCTMAGDSTTARVSCTRACSGVGTKSTLRGARRGPRDRNSKPKWLSQRPGFLERGLPSLPTSYRGFALCGSAVSFPAGSRAMPRQPKVWCILGSLGEFSCSPATQNRV